MPQIINTNIPSLTAQRNLNTSQGSLAVALNRLSSGLRVNSAKDDAAGLAIATRLEAQSRGMGMAIRNANDAVSFVQTAEGGIAKINEALQRMRELAVQAANGTYTASDRSNLNAEFQQLSSEVARVASQTEFNGLQMFNGSGNQTFQVGANVGQTIDIQIGDFTDVSIAQSGSNITNVANANAVLASIDLAMNAVNTQRANLGGAQSRLDAVVSQLQVSRENQESSRSRIMDADYAEETARLTRAQILQQAGTAMLAQANSVPNNVLTLLRQ
jgi:flagellin